MDLTTQHSRGGMFRRLRRPQPGGRGARTTRPPYPNTRRETELGGREHPSEERGNTPNPAECVRTEEGTKHKNQLYQRTGSVLSN